MGRGLHPSPVKPGISYPPHTMGSSPDARAYGGPQACDAHMRAAARDRTDGTGDAPRRPGGVVLCARGDGPIDEAVARVAITLAAATGATLRGVRPPPWRTSPAGLPHPARVDALLRAARRFGADWLVVGVDERPGRAAPFATELALGLRRPVAVVQRTPVRRGGMLAHVPDEDILARATLGAGLACADAFEEPLTAVCALPTHHGARPGRVELEGRLAEHPRERQALARLGRALPAAEPLGRVHVQLRRGVPVTQLVVAAQELRTEVAVVAGDAPTLLSDRAHERLLAAGVAVVVERLLE